MIVRDKRIIWSVISFCLLMFYTNCSGYRSRINKENALLSIQEDHEENQTEEPDKFEYIEEIENSDSTSEVSQNSDEPIKSEVTLIKEAPTLEEFQMYLPKISDEKCAVNYPWKDWKGLYRDKDFTPITVCQNGCNYKSIEEALINAKPFDEIRIEPGHYQSCLTTNVSPLKIIGDGGFAEIKATEGCRDTISIKNGMVHLRNLKLSSSSTLGGGILIYPDAEQVKVESVWISDSDFAIRGSPGLKRDTGGEVLILNSKFKGVGYRETPTSHQRAILNLSPKDSLIVKKSVFSHFRNQAWTGGHHGTKSVEYSCNVVLRNNGDNGNHSFHIYYPKYVHLRNNYFHEDIGKIISYVSSGVPYTFEAVNNRIWFENPEARFLSNINNRFAQVIAVGNQIVGGQGLYGGLFLSTELENNIHTMEYNELDFPQSGIPKEWPLDKL